MQLLKYLLSFPAVREPSRQVDGKPATILYGGTPTMKHQI